MKHSITAICTSFAVSSMLFSSVTASETTVLLADSVYSLSVPSDPTSERIFAGYPVKSYKDIGYSLPIREWISNDEYHFEWLYSNSEGLIYKTIGYDCSIEDYENNQPNPQASNSIWSPAQGIELKFDELNRIILDSTSYSGGWAWLPSQVNKYSYSADGDTCYHVYTNRFATTDTVPETESVILMSDDNFPLSGIVYKYQDGAGVGIKYESFRKTYTVVNGKKLLDSIITYSATDTRSSYTKYSYDNLGRLLEEYKYTDAWVAGNGSSIDEKSMLTVHHYGVPSGVAISSGNRTQKAAVMPVKLLGKTLVSLASRPVQAEIFTVNGKKVAFGALPLEFPSSGIFIVKIAGIEGTLISRMVVR